MTTKIKIAWLLTFLALSFIIVPLVIYDELRPSSLCTNFGFTNPITGVCFGSFFFGTVTLEHEGVGLGMIMAASIFAVKRLEPVSLSFGGVGFLLLISDCCNDFIANTQGSLVSIALGFTYIFVLIELVKPQDLGEVDAPF